MKISLILFLIILFFVILYSATTIYGGCRSSRSYDYWDNHAPRSYYKYPNNNSKICESYCVHNVCYWRCY